MNLPLAVELIERFRLVLTLRLGLCFEDSRLCHVLEVLQARVVAAGGDAVAYVERLEAQPSDEELTLLARELTVPETYFFRHSQQFDALRAIVREKYLCLGKLPPRVLSAGCASGEEAYSLAALLFDCWPERDPSIVALDVNPWILARAREGRFSAWSLRETPAALATRWFRQQGRDYVLDELLRRSVRFVSANLALDHQEVLASQSYDVIFCRNVLMYFSPEKREEAVARLASALVPGGYLFLGSAETLRGVSQEFHLCHTHEAFYYQRKLAHDRLPSSRRCKTRSDRPAPLRLVPPEAGWADEIGRASARISALAREPSVACSVPSLVPSVSAKESPWDLSGALELMHKEQFSGALAHVRALPPDAALDPDALLLEAVLLASAGSFVEAEETCLRLLGLDELCAGAHYVLALCGAGTGRQGTAMHHDRVATYLDPGFAMPRLHLGLLLRRAGEMGDARLELTQARSLIEREDAARILMFGGGFGRAALLALCSAELDTTAGPPR